MVSRQNIQISTAIKRIFYTLLATERRYAKTERLVASHEWEMFPLSMRTLNSHTKIHFTSGSIYWAMPLFPEGVTKPVFFCKCTPTPDSVFSK